MKTIALFILTALASLFLWALPGSPGNLHWVQSRAGSYWRNAGFEIVTPEGYQWGPGGFGTTYGGAKVWYMVRKTNDPTIIYDGYLSRWGDELSLYSFTAIDAIQPKSL